MLCLFVCFSGKMNLFTWDISSGFSQTPEHVGIINAKKLLRRTLENNSQVQWFEFKFIWVVSDCPSVVRNGPEGQMRLWSFLDIYFMNRVVSSGFMCTQTPPGGQRWTHIQYFRSSIWIIHFKQTQPNVQNSIIECSFVVGFKGGTTWVIDSWRSGSHSGGQRGRHLVQRVRWSSPDTVGRKCQEFSGLTQKESDQVSVPGDVFMFHSEKKKSKSTHTRVWTWRIRRAFESEGTQMTRSYSCPTWISATRQIPGQDSVTFVSCRSSVAAGRKETRWSSCLRVSRKFCHSLF